MHKRMAALAVGVLAALIVPVGGAEVSAASGTTCEVEHVPTLTPGLSVQGSTGTFEDKVAGSISCSGPLLGITPTGPGTVYDKGNYGTEDPDSCFGGGEGVGSYTLSFPTADGPEELVAPFTVTFGEPATNGHGLVTVKLQGEGWTGDLAATPTKGDCFSAPVTEVVVKGTLQFD
jgi:hypothetical protein